jgi:protease-4
VKPVIASFSDLAASGGYYIAAGADSIVAAPGTLTGSIGVFGGKLNLLGLYHKLGLNIETVSRGRHAEMFSSVKDFTPDEAARFSAQMAAVYRAFVDRVARGRGLDTTTVDSIGQGHIWSGTAGRERGLVDALGGFERAFAIARGRAGLEPDAPIVIDVFPRVERSFLQRFFTDLVPDTDDSDNTSALTPAMQAWLAATRFPNGAVLALMPYHIEIR